MQKLIDEGYEAYVIGGCVRDFLLGRKPHDYDIFTNATGDQILELFPEGKVLGNEERQKKILTVIVDGVEISQYRKNGDRTETGTSLKEHQKTCDFTFNSIAMDIEGNIIDINKGQEDLKKRLVRFVGKPEDRIKEDPLRILRGFRFVSKYGFLFEKDTGFKLHDHRKLLLDLPKERIREEMLKIFNGPDYHNIFECIFEDFFPELYHENHFKYGGDHHDETPFEHMKNSFEEAFKLTSNPLLRLACRLHDVAKGLTTTKDEDGKQIHFYGHENIGEKLMKEKLVKLKFSTEEIDYITTLIRLHMYSYNATPGKKSYIRFFDKLEKAKIPIEDYIILIYCDRQGNLAKPRIKFGEFLKGNWLLKKYYEIKYSEEPMNVTDLKVGGKDVMEILKIEPGPDIGKILNALFEEVMEGNIKNERGELMNELKKIVVGDKK